MHKWFLRLNIESFFSLYQAIQKPIQSFLRQIHNILVAAPNSKIEVVTHGMGVDLLKAKG
jgi:uncharacterized protein